MSKVAIGTIRKPLKVTLLLLLFLIAGVLFGRLIQLYWPTLKQAFSDNTTLYHTANSALLAEFNREKITRLGWEDLLPETEKHELQRYQSNNTADSSVATQSATEQSLSDNMLLAIQASTDEDYAAALHSTNIVKDVIGKPISISGFVVPIEVNEDRTLRSFFVVPYYGACIHFPPPPPNQIIFVQLSDGFAHHNLADAFTLTGVLEQGMYEDPLGTSAYILNVYDIEAYYGQPDEFRTH